MTKFAGLFVALIITITLASCVSPYGNEIASFQCPKALSQDEINVFRDEKYLDALDHEKLYSRAPRALPEDRDTRNLDYAYSTYIDDANDDNPIAQMLLGSLHGLYEYGDNPSREMEYWFLKSAQNGFVTAQFLLGILYTDGRDKIQNTELGHLWYECAASNGSNQAKEYLEQIYD